MIRVTRLDQQEIVLNCELFESIESRPDTTIRMVTGASLVVRESVEELLERVRAWRAGVLTRAGLPGLLARSPALPGVLLRTEPDRASESDRATQEVPA